MLEAVAGDVDYVRQHAVEDVLSTLRAEGNRVTTARRLLIQCLVEATGHQTAEQLAESVHSLAPDVHLSTIYRNLEEFERLGVITHSHFGHGPATYHLSTDMHGHFVCEQCSTAFEAPDGLFAALAAAATAEYEFVIDPHHFAVLGRCANCRASDAAALVVERQPSGAR